MINDEAKTAAPKEGEEAELSALLQKGKLNLEDLRKMPGLGRGLWRQVSLLGQMLRAWWQKQYRAPWRLIGAVVVVLLYILNPLDLVPDALPLIGAIDDLFVFGLGAALSRSELRRYCQEKNLDPKEFGL